MGPSTCRPQGKANLLPRDPHSPTCDTHWPIQYNTRWRLRRARCVPAPVASTPHVSPAPPPDSPVAWEQPIPRFADQKTKPLSLAAGHHTLLQPSGSDWPLTEQLLCARCCKGFWAHLRHREPAVCQAVREARMNKQITKVKTQEIVQSLLFANERSETQRTTCSRSPSKWVAGPAGTWLLTQHPSPMERLLRI